MAGQFQLFAAEFTLPPAISAFYKRRQGAADLAARAIICLEAKMGAAYLGSGAV